MEQDLEIQCGNHRFRATFNLADRHERGLLAHEKGNRNLDLDLRTIKQEIALERKKKGIMKPLSKEDIFMMS